MSKSKRPTRMQRRYQSEFKDWLQENKSRFMRPLCVKKKLHRLELSFQDMNSAIAIRVKEHSIAVFVVWNGRHFDYLLDLEIAPKWDHDAYVCSLCKLEYQKRYKDVAAMRREHLFDEFLAWCNQDFFNASHLEMLQTSGATSARLVNGVNGPIDKGFVAFMTQLRNVNGNNYFRKEDLKSSYIPLFS